MKYLILFASVVFLSFIPNSTPVYKDELRQKIKIILDEFGGDVGVALLDLETRDTLSFNGRSHHAMQSVYKFPLAMAVLHQVDKGKFSLDQKIHVTKKDLLPNTWSPLREKYPNGEVDLTLREILSATVSESDNNGCDILFRLLGGPKKVNAYIHSLGVKGIAIVATEEQMHADWKVQFTNWGEPKALVQLLDLLYQGKTLSKSSNDFLMKIMQDTYTGPDRIRGLLPAETVVAHKTGSSGNIDETGEMAATNDIGIVTLTNGRHFAIVVLVAHKSADQDRSARVIAEVTKAVWDNSLEQ